MTTNHDQPLRPTIPTNGSCASCTLKHLRAAYAHCTALEGLSFDRYSLWNHNMAGNVHLARAVILAREALVGYCDNVTLALGCIASAESLVFPGDVKLLRDIRVTAENSTAPLASMIRGLCSELNAQLPQLMPLDQTREASFMAANLFEALRESPPENTYTGLIPLGQMLKDLLEGRFPSNGFEARDYSIHLFNIIKALEVHYGLEIGNPGKDVAPETGSGEGK